MVIFLLHVYITSQDVMWIQRASSIYKVGIYTKPFASINYQLSPTFHPNGISLQAIASSYGLPCINSPFFPHVVNQISCQWRHHSICDVQHPCTCDLSIIFHHDLWSATCTFLCNIYIWPVFKLFSTTSVRLKDPLDILIFLQNTKDIMLSS